MAIAYCTLVPGADHTQCPSSVECSHVTADMLDTDKADEPERMYLVCMNCGEAFDDITIASKHTGDNGEDEPLSCFDDRHSPMFGIRPESEAL